MTTDDRGLPRMRNPTAQPELTMQVLTTAPCPTAQPEL